MTGAMVLLVFLGLLWGLGIWDGFGWVARLVRAWYRTTHEKRD